MSTRVSYSAEVKLEGTPVKAVMEQLNYEI
jgi:hypothetical protein